jgi:hypothetical protein
VTHESSRHWRLKFGADSARTLRRRRLLTIRIRGVLHHFWRAVDQHRARRPQKALVGDRGQGAGDIGPENKRVKFTSLRATKSNAAPNPDAPTKVLSKKLRGRQ